MKKSRFSEEKVISILREADAGVKVAELARKMDGLAILAKEAMRLDPFFGSVFVFVIRRHASGEMPARHRMKHWPGMA